MDRGEALRKFGARIGVAARPRVASTAPSFPDGAFIRTLRKDYQPEEPGGGQAVRSRGIGCKSPAERPCSGTGLLPPPDLCFVRIDLPTEAIAKRDGTVRNGARDAHVEAGDVASRALIKIRDADRGG
jgi:hypothetical protein